MISELRQESSPRHHNHHPFNKLHEVWRNSGKEYFTSLFRPDLYQPWGLTGEVPIEWWLNNYKQFIFSESDISSRAAHYNIATIPDGAGLYFLFLDSDLVYVGITACYRDRFRQHIESGKQFNSYSIIPDVPGIFMADLEAFYIGWLRPAFNNKFPTVFSPLDKELSAIEKAGEHYCAIVISGKSGRTVRRWKHKDGESSFKEFGLPGPLRNPFCWGRQNGASGRKAWKDQ